MDRTILVVDDNASIRTPLVKILKKEDLTVFEAESGESALEILQSEDIALLLTDLKLPGIDGLELFQQARKIRQHLECIVFTGFGTVETAVEAMRQGVRDFVTKPIDRHILLKTIQRALETKHLLHENQSLRAKLTSLESKNRLLGRSPAMRHLLDLIEQVAPSRATVLLLGESGTGKELVAQALHELSNRHDKPFVKVACAALPETLLEAELFGYEKGAFTGAGARKEGRFKLADAGTLLLDEVGEIPLSMQVKLLRVLQENEFERVGGTQTLRVDVRLVAATNRDLAQEVEQKRFREDLYYRVNVITLRIPPLRERPEDIPILAVHFLQHYGAQNGKNGLELSKEAIDLLLSYSWPGNVRQLENAIERAVVLARKPIIGIEDFPFQQPTQPANSVGKSLCVSFPIGTPLHVVEKTMIDETLRSTKGDKEAAAALLGISSRTIYRKLNENSQERSPTKPTTLYA